MTTARDVIAAIMCDLDNMSPADDIDLAIADLFIERLKCAPESVRMELVALLKNQLPVQRCDTCDNGVAQNWIFCPWCAEPLPAPPSETKR